MNISIGNSTLDGITWNNQGTITMSSGGVEDFVLANSAVLNNQATGTFTVTSGSTASDILGSASETINNAGTWVNNTSAARDIFVTFNNTGQVNVISNTMNLNVGGTDTGDYAISSGATVDFLAGTRTFASTTDFTGNGTVDWSSGTQTLNTSSFASTLTLSITGATVDFNNATSIGSLVLTTGTLQADAAVTVTNGFTWGGGTSEVNGSGSLTTTSGVTAGTMSISVGNLTLNGITWNNAGAITMTSGGVEDFVMSNSAILNNQATGTITSNISNTTSDILGSASETINNAGTWVNNSTQAHDINSSFNNTGQVNVTGNTINLNAGGTDTGDYAVSSGATLNFAGGTRNLNGVTITGSGTINFSGGTIQTNNNNLSITAADLIMSVGLDVGTGTLTLSSAGGTLGLGTGTGTMSITDAELLLITADTLNIGASTDGNMDINTVTTGGIANVSNVNLASGGNITFATNTMNVFNSSKMASISAASGTVTVPGLAAGTIGLGDADCGGSCGFSISGTKLATITANTLFVGGSASGNLFVDGVTAANVANISTLSLNATIATGTITVSGTASSVQGLTLNADDGVTLSTNVATSGAMTVDADTDNDGVGDLSLTAGTLDTGNNNLTVTANDLSINISGAATITSGTGSASFAVSDGGTIGVGDSTCGGTCGMQVSGSEIGAITAGSLTLGDATSGAMTVENVTLANTANISNTLTLSSGSTVDFNTTTSSFTNSFAVTAVGNITQSVAISVGGTTTGFSSTGGDITMNNASNSLSSNLILDTNDSFTVVTTSTLTDLAMTVDPAGCAPCTYSVTDSGNLTMTLTDSGTDVDIAGLSLSSGNLNFSLTTDSGAFTTSGTMNVGTGSFSVATNGNVDDAITISNTIAAGSLVLDANGQQSDVNINTTVSILTGSVALTADDSIVFGTGSSLTATGAGNVTIEANTDTADGANGDAISMDDNSFVDAGSGTISLTATGTGAGNITVGRLITTSSSSSAISLNSLSTIFDAGDTLTDNFNAINGGLVMVAGSSIGISNGTSLEIDVASLDVTNSANSLFANLLSDISITNLAINTQANFIGTGSITQTGAIVVGALTANTTGAITLTNTSNNVNSISFSVTGNIDYVDADVFSVNSTNGIQGVRTTGGSVHLTSTAGDINVTNITGNDIDATAGISLLAAANEGAVNINSGANITTSAGDIDIKADNMALDGTIVASGQRVTLKSVQAGDAIDLGDTLDSGFNILELSDTELDNITANYLEIGSTTQGAITLSADVSPANVMVAHLISSSTVTGTAGGIVVGDLAIEAGGDVNFTDTTTDVNNLAIDATGFDVTFYDTDDLDIDTVDGVVGVKAKTFTTNGPGPLTTTSAIILDSTEETVTQEEEAQVDEGSQSTFVTDFTSPAESGC